MPVCELPYDDSRLIINIPDEWLGEIVASVPVQPAADPVELIAAAMSHPIGAPAVEQFARAGQKVALLVDDTTRKTPAHLLLHPALHTLQVAGIRPEDITIILALGSHRPMLDSEIKTKVGQQLQEKYRILNIPAEDDQVMVYLGLSSSGIPVSVLRELAAADLRIGLGMITPHMDAGFSGGAKIVLPGACSLRTVDAFHSLAVSQAENPLGNPNAPLRLELEQFVARHVPLHFIVNLVLTPDHLVYQCVAGDPVAAHRVGVDFARTVYGAAVQRRYPLVVANCYPYQQDLWQSMKGLSCGDLLTQDGGTLVLLTHAGEGHSSYPLLPGYIAQHPQALLRELMAGQVTDPKSAATGVLVGRMKQRIRLALVSHGLGQRDAQMMGFDWHDRLETALEKEVSRLLPDKRRHCLAMIPQAGVTLPLLPGTNTP